MTAKNIVIEVAAGTASVIMNRPEVHNAFNDAVIAELTEALRDLGNDPRVRIVLLKGAGESFCAGAEVAWMQKAAAFTQEQNFTDALALAELLRTLDQLPKPTIAVVQGPAFGGGVGLVAACDIALAATSASFCLSEVKLGLIPSVISPYVIAGIGERASRRYFLTAERFCARDAYRLGLVHEVVPDDELKERSHIFAEQLQTGGPQAQAAVKELIREIAHRPVDQTLIEETARRIALQRASEEGREGISAFLGKRKPAWTA
ncbi:MAG TPA: enoyl-CoA hydratase/isomerase family protein [Beijerinckia sp.]|jgi:methylglutaconyl-CoA hydratase|nr:enoyl-CoA hydratase/isomerase family protein [Beijerinckia sp.]